MYEKMIAEYLFLSELIELVERRLNKIARNCDWFYVINYETSIRCSDAYAAISEAKYRLIYIDHAIQWSNWERAALLASKVEEEILPLFPA